jgi:uncharacterized membrane protein
MMKKLSNRAVAVLLTAALVVIVLLLVVSIILLPQWFAMTVVFLPLTVLLLYVIYRVILAVLADREAERVWIERNNYKQPPSKP